MYIPRRICKLSKLLLVLLVVVPVIWTGAWLSHQSSTRCVTRLNNPFLVVGVFLSVLSLAYLVIYIINQGNDRNPATNCISFCILVLFLVLLGYTIFALVVTTGPGQTGGSDTFTKWLHNLVLDDNHWRNIKDCFVFKTKVCSEFIHGFQTDTYQQFQSRHFSSVQSGCCKPLKECNFTYISPAVWTKSKNSTFSNSDCEEWSNDPFVLCFNCQSCKDGFLHDINRSWKKAALVNILVIFALAMLCWCGDCGPDPEEDDDHQMYQDI